jgi:hypothetical protein
MKIFLITHGDRQYGVNAGHTEKELAQIKLISLPAGISLVVLGTGRRFKEIYENLQEKIKGISILYSPFAGSADSFDQNNELPHRKRMG